MNLVLTRGREEVQNQENLAPLGQKALAIQRALSKLIVTLTNNLLPCLLIMYSFKVV